MLKTSTVIGADNMRVQVRFNTNLKSNYETVDKGMDSVENEAAPIPYSNTAVPGSNLGHVTKKSNFFSLMNNINSFECVNNL